jgi:hypothetical protein
MPDFGNGVYMPQDATDTQIEAAAAARHSATAAREQVILALMAARAEGIVGLTDLEIAAVTGLYLNTAAPSRNTLVKRGKVEDSGLRRKNERGRNMIVWKLVPSA